MMKSIKSEVNKNLFPKRLKALRERNDLTIAQAEKYVGAGRNTWMQWENGNRVPSMTTVIGIASVFKVSSAYLSGNDDDEALGTLSFPTPKLSVDDKKIVEKYSTLTRNEKIFVGRVIDFIISHRDRP